MTYEEIEAAAPAEFAARAKSKLAYRYPRGESYLDVITRLDPVIHAIERHKVPVVIVAHQGILRLLYAYFKGEFIFILPLHFDRTVLLTIIDSPP